MTRITIKESGIKPSLYKKIRDHALSSLYRLNASTSDLYTFEIDVDGNDWSGGWSWSEYPGTWDGSLAINLKDKKLYKLN